MYTKANKYKNRKESNCKTRAPHSGQHNFTVVKFKNKIAI